MIRDVLENDSFALAKIHKECFHKNWKENDFRKMLKNNVFSGFAEVDENVIRGFILYKIVFDEIEIITFCVPPMFSKRGIARLLISKVTEFAKSCSVKKIFLEVAENNIAAMNLYKSVGYIEISNRANYYEIDKEQKISAVIMRLDI